MKNEGIKIGFNFTVKPVTAVMIALALTGTYAAGYHVGITDAAKIFFPNSSPIFHRPISLQGTIQKSESGQYYLSVPDNPLWLLKPVTNINLENVLNELPRSRAARYQEQVLVTQFCDRAASCSVLCDNKQVTVKGNLTSEQNVINVTEVIAFEKPNPVVYPASKPATNSAQPTY